MDTLFLERSLTAEEITEAFGPTIAKMRREGESIQELATRLARAADTTHTRYTLTLLRGGAEPRLATASRIAHVITERDWSAEKGYFVIRKFNTVIKNTLASRRDLNLTWLRQVTGVGGHVLRALSTETNTWNPPLHIAIKITRALNLCLDNALHEIISQIDPTWPEDTCGILEMEIPEDFGLQLMKVAQNKNLELHALAQMAKLEELRVAKILNGNANPTNQEIVRLALAVVAL